MKDFMITPYGDLMFTETNTESRSLCISFYKSNSSVLRISFDTYSYEEIQPSNNALTISFDLNEIKNNKRVSIVSDETCLVQQILMRLQTSLGELSLRSDIGSRLEVVMHQNIMDKKVQDNIKKLVLESIKDLLSDPVIKVTPLIDKSDGYEQCVSLKIYQDGSLLLNYEME